MEFVDNGVQLTDLQLLQIGMFLAAVVTKAFSGLESDWGEFGCEAMDHRLAILLTFTTYHLSTGEDSMERYVVALNRHLSPSA